MDLLVFGYHRYIMCRNVVYLYNFQEDCIVCLFFLVISLFNISFVIILVSNHMC